MKKIDLIVLALTFALAIYTSVLYFMDMERIENAYKSCAQYYQIYYDCVRIGEPVPPNSSILGNYSWDFG